MTEMTDIVERLRAIRAAHVGYLLSRKDIDDITEAADEIERLRAQVGRMSEEPAEETAKIAQAVAAERAAILGLIRDLEIGSPTWEPAFCEGIDYARKALTAAIWARATGHLRGQQS
jgi:hypothetical protein